MCKRYDSKYDDTQNCSSTIRTIVFLLGYPWISKLPSLPLTNITSKVWVGSTAKQLVFGPPKTCNSSNLRPCWQRTPGPTLRSVDQVLKRQAPRNGLRHLGPPASPLGALLDAGLLGGEATKMSVM